MGTREITKSYSCKKSSDLVIFTNHKAMLQPRTLKILAAFLICILLVSLPILVWLGYFDSPVGIGVAIPYLSIYLFHQIGIPGLLQNNGLCGWGWCAPTTFGWIFPSIFWLLVIWLIAWAAASLTGNSNTAPPPKNKQTILG